MVVLSLFDGMSCGQIALKELGVKVDKYYASEIDKHAIKQTMLNFPDTIQLGSVTDVDVSKLDKIDLLIGGSPCTNFSFAGKRNGMSTTTNEEIYTLDRYLELKADGFQFEGESFLFWEYMRILNDIRKYNPDVKFLLENVEMGKKWERTLSEAIGIFGVHINSALVSAQNRKRIYWTNIRTQQIGLFGEIYSDIPQPEDRGILLKDILEDKVDEKYYLSDKLLKSLTSDKNVGGGCWKAMIPKSIEDKSSTLTARMFKMGKNDTYNKIDKKGNCKSNQDKASCFTAGGNSGGNHSDMDLVCIPCDYRHSEGIRFKADGKTGTLLSRARNDESCGQMVCVAMRGRNPENPSDRTTGSPTEQRIEPRTDGKTNTLTTVQKDNLIMQLNTSKESGGNQPYQQNRVYDINGIVPALLAQMSCGAHKILVPYKQNDDNSIFQLPRGNNKGGFFEDKSPTMSSSSWDRNNFLCQRQQKKFKGDNEKANTFLSTSWKGSQANGMTLVERNYRIRRLTPTECSRLQTIPEWYKWECSDTQAYKMLGNGWTVEVIKHILKHME
jgi:DNA (cytosine-5)-methyltransferase 3A